MDRTLILASESPRRSELLTQASIPFVTESAHAPEISDGLPQAVTLHNALAKAQAVWRLHDGETVLGADTIVCVDGRIFGKPKDEADARRMLGELNGRWHEVYTGVALIDGEGNSHTACTMTRVHFVTMTEAEITGYIATGEPFGKAGAYAIQGRAGYYIDQIEGSFSNVVGLPLATVRDLMKSIEH